MKKLFKVMMTIVTIGVVGVAASGMQVTTFASEVGGNKSDTEKFFDDPVQYLLERGIEENAPSIPGFNGDVKLSGLGEKLAPYAADIVEGGVPIISMASSTYGVSKCVYDQIKDGKFSAEKTGQCLVEQIPYQRTVQKAFKKVKSWF